MNILKNIRIKPHKGFTNNKKFDIIIL